MRRGTIIVRILVLAVLLSLIYESGKDVYVKFLNHTETPHPEVETNATSQPLEEIERIDQDLSYPQGMIAYI